MAVLVIRIPLDDDGIQAATIAEAVVEGELEEDLARKVVGNGGSLAELLVEVLVAGGIDVSEDDLRFAIETDGIGG